MEVLNSRLGRDGFLNQRYILETKENLINLCQEKTREFMEMSKDNEQLQYNNFMPALESITLNLSNYKS
jgi:hypothetical protein